MKAPLPRILYSVAGGFVLNVFVIVAWTAGSTMGISIALLVLSAAFVVSHLIMDKNSQLRIVYVTIIALCQFSFHQQEASIQLVQYWPDAADILGSPLKYRMALTSTGLAAACFWIGLVSILGKYRIPRNVL